MISGKPLLLLHGALGASGQFVELARLLEESHGFDVATLDFPGHGGSPVMEEPFSIAGFASYLAEWIEENGKGGIDIFGYSMGGYVALHLALERPELVGRIFTLATKFAWDPATSAREVKMLDPDAIEAKVPKFAEQLKSRHAPADWRAVLAKTAQMMLNLGDRRELPIESLAGVGNHVTIGIGDRDQMVSMEESLAAYRALPNGRFIAMPGTPHPIEKVSPVRLARELGEFFLD
jgi:pimeloyl-ACP methyl ester carboxylesterase